MHVGLTVSDDIDYGLDLANALTGLGIEVTLYLSHARTAMFLCGDGAGAVPYRGQRLVERLYELQLLPTACKVRMFDFPRIRDLRSAIVNARIGRAMRQDGVDVAHILMGPGQLWIAVLASMVRAMPVVSTMIIPKPNVGENLPPFLVKAINRLLAFGSDLVIVNGADQVVQVENLYGLSGSRIRHVPLGPRTTASRWATRQLAEEPGTILFFGRAAHHKGLEYLVRAQPLISRKIPHARFLIAAHGPHLAQCRQLISDNTRFEIHEGFLSGAVLAEFFQRASLVALPYLSASTSGILMTACVFGKPVVATSVGCLPEYVKPGVTGLLVPPADPDQLAEAIIALLSDDRLRQRMGDNAKCWAAETERRVALESLAAYQKALSL